MLIIKFIVIFRLSWIAFATLLNMKTVLVIFILFVSCYADVFSPANGMFSTGNEDIDDRINPAGNEFGDSTDDIKYNSRMLFANGYSGDLHAPKRTQSNLFVSSYQGTG